MILQDLYSRVIFILGVCLFVCALVLQSLPRYPGLPEGLCRILNEVSESDLVPRVYDIWSEFCLLILLCTRWSL